MTTPTKEDLVERGTVVLQVLGIVGVYFAILGALIYPVLRATGYLT